VIDLDLQAFFGQLFVLLDAQENHVIITAVFWGLVLLAVVWRIASHVHFRGVLGAFLIESRKEIAARGDVAKLKNSLLRKVVSEYMRVADRAVTTVPTATLVDRAINGMSLAGWKYDNVIPFVEGLEAGLLWIALILAVVFNEFAFVYGTLAVISFLIVRLTVAFFNVRGAREQLATELILYIEREIGRFFASDHGGAILRLKNDLTETIERQTTAYKTTMDSIGSIMTTTLNEVAKSMTAASASIAPTVAAALDEKLIDMNAALSATLQHWKEALTESAAIQSKMNDSSTKLSHAATKVQTASELLATHLQGHSNAQSNQLVQLVTAIDSVKQVADSLTAQQAALTKQTGYIERNQTTLDTTIHAYEDALQNLTKTLGEGLGAFIDLHAQTSVQTINDALKLNIDKIMQLVIKEGGGV